MPRKEKKLHFIYKTTNLLTGRYYIGMHSTDDLEDGYLGSGKRLRYSVRKYGKQNHQREVLEFVGSREELRDREKEIISLDEIAKEDCMNLVEGGQGGFTIEQQKLGAKAKNEKHKDKLSYWSRKAGKANITKNGFKVLQDNRCDWTGKNHSEDSIEKMKLVKSNHGSGESNSQFGTCWVTNEENNKKVKKEDLDHYLKLGWRKGRKMGK